MGADSSVFATQGHRLGCPHAVFESPGLRGRGVPGCTWVPPTPCRLRPVSPSPTPLPCRRSACGTLGPRGQVSLRSAHSPSAPHVTWSLFFLESGSKSFGKILTNKKDTNLTQNWKRQTWLALDRVGGRRFLRSRDVAIYQVPLWVCVCTLPLPESMMQRTFPTSFLRPQRQLSPSWHTNLVTEQVHLCPHRRAPGGHRLVRRAHTVSCGSDSHGPELSRCRLRVSAAVLEGGEAALGL